MMRFGLSGCGAGFESVRPTEWPRFAQMAEAAGFDSLWINEEHFQLPRDGRGRICLSPVVVASQLAAHTHRIRIGFSVLLLPLHQPIRLAEELASLDVLSGGRINFGVSRGGNGDYSKAFGVDPAAGRQAFQQDLSCMLQCWSSKPVHINGHDFDVQPKPLQNPHPPVYLGTYNEQTAEWAGQQGYRLIQHGIQSVPNIRRIVEAFSSGGGDLGHLPIGRFVYVSSSDESARAELLPVIQMLTDRLRKAGIPSRAGTLTERELEPERFYREMVIAGGPHSCREQLKELQRMTGCRHVNCLAAFFGFLPPDLFQRSLQLFAEEVMPHLGDCSK